MKKNKDKSAHGRRYSNEVKRFAVTMHYYSPKAYDYCRLASITFFRFIFPVRNDSSIDVELMLTSSNQHLFNIVLMSEDESLLTGLSTHSSISFPCPRTNHFSQSYQLIPVNTNTITDQEQSNFCLLFKVVLALLVFCIHFNNFIAKCLKYCNIVSCKITLMAK